MQYPKNIDVFSHAALFSDFHFESSNSVAGVSAAGDLNNDGFGDFIIADRGFDNDGLPTRGFSYVIFGGSELLDNVVYLPELKPSVGFTIVGASEGERSGDSVAAAGDVNGDGFDDLILGARLAAPNGEYSGAAYVVFGKADGFGAEISLGSLNGVNGFRLSGSQSLEQAGIRVSSAGDVNHDGFDDLLVGTSSPNEGGSVSKTYVVFGKGTGFAADLDLSTLNGSSGFQIIGSKSAERIASAGDVNGDGFDDMIIGAPLDNVHAPGDQAGATYVVFGKGGGFGATVNLASLSGASGFRISGVAEGDNAGTSVASAGDVNGDGYADLIVGAPFSESSAGTGYVVFGKAGGFAANLDLANLNGSNGFKINGVSAHDRSGSVVASAGDVNGDGFDDVVIGAPGVDGPGDNTGEIYIVFGKAGGFGAGLDLATLNGTNGFKLTGGYIGTSVASAGDVNADGFSDILIGRSTTGVLLTGLKPDAAVNRTGTDADQTLAGGDFNDILRGLGGDDRLWGHGGKDRLEGGDGDDVLRGGAGKDILIGGANQDSFVFDTDLKKSRDKIVDFSPSDDTIFLSASIFDGLQSRGSLANSEFSIGKAAKDKKDRILYDKKTGVLSYDSDGSKQKFKPLKFAKLEDHLKLDADDFMVI